MNSANQLDKLTARKAQKAERERKYRETNREKIRESKRKWNAANREKKKEQGRKYRAANREKGNEYNLQRQYGLTISARAALFAEQERRCLVCKDEFDFSYYRGPKAPVVDHCHETGATRGILCQRCNKALGHIRSKTHYRQLGRYLFGRDYQSAQEVFV